MPPTSRRHGPCRARPAPVDALRRAAADQGQRACARGHRDRPGRALSPPVPGRRCGVNCPEGQFNITGCCTHARRSVRQAHSRRACAQPPLCLAPLRACAGIGSGYRAHARRTPKHVRPWLRHRRKGSWSGALRAQSWSWPPPAHHPPPEGAPWLPPLSLLSVAPCSPRQGFASPLRALDPAARGTP